MDKYQRIEIFVPAKDYLSWQTVEEHVFRHALASHASYAKSVIATRLGLIIAFCLMVSTLWALHYFVVGIALFVVAFKLYKNIEPLIRNLYRQELEDFLKDELALMREILRSTNNLNIEAVDVHSSPWVNARYLLRKQM